MMNLASYLETWCRVVDEALDARMPSTEQPPAVLHEAMRYTVFSGGKRLRPVLCLAAAEAINPAATKSALWPAMAIELLHTYTLVHDDLPSMDDDDTRRGRPTCHRRFGTANAILCGDALQALAFQVAAETPGIEDRVRNALVRELAQAAGSHGVVGGQVDDLACCGKALDLETLTSVHLRKTAALFVAAIRMGARCADAPVATLTALDLYARNLGLAFQIADDLLDREEHPDTGELSYLSVCTPDEARQRASTLVETGLQSLQGLHLTTAEPLSALLQYCTERNR
jgi:geranylgeranyl pyrophosphate synthase